MPKTPRDDAALARLRRELAAGRVARLAEAEWERLAAGFTVVAEHDTRIAGPLLVVRDGDGAWAAVERPAPGERAVRPLAGRKAADAFVRRRLDAYDRMWDGCGCKVDYYG